MPQPPYLSDEIEIPEAHYAAIGRVVDAWAELEFEIDQFIWHLTQTPQALAACVTAQIISIYLRMQALVSLVNLYMRDEELIKELNKFSGDVGQLAEKRNRIIHDRRFVQVETKKVVRFQITAKTTLDFRTERGKNN
jgi:hypothetical protein